MNAHKGRVSSACKFVNNVKNTDDLNRVLENLKQGTGIGLKRHGSVGQGLLEQREGCQEGEVGFAIWGSNHFLVLLTSLMMLGILFRFFGVCWGSL